MEYMNTDDFVAPIPAVQYFLLLLAAKKPERLREIFAYEKKIADKLLTVPESEAVGKNKRYLCLFQITWKMLQWSQEYNRVGRLPWRHPTGSRWWLCYDWMQYSGQNKHWKHHTDMQHWGIMLTNRLSHSKRLRMMFSSRLLSMDAVMGCEGGIVWLDSLFWYMLNNLDKYWPDSSLTSSDCLAIFLSLLMANPQCTLHYIHHLAERKWLVKEGTESEQKFVHLRYISVGFERISIRTLMEMIGLDMELLDPIVTYLDETGHVGTLDPKILGSRILMAVIEKGLNHITPKPLQTAKIIAEICEAWDQIASIILDVYICNWPSNEAAVKQHINYHGNTKLLDHHNRRCDDHPQGITATGVGT
ncbi:hypothetical protein SELMODRAFT_431106 [Selaginella moellendorffii]|uniref:Uncharacterized protein n=1 Tax=Selaginella moellendorffii TaxID=88036 RepID=D8TBJ3_SELML|nr:hypothetical protein SELMODRAFT_431106 [Selaginella moellendorffii]